MYKLLPPEPLRLPTFTASRGGIRFIQPPDDVLDIAIAVQ